MIDPDTHVIQLAQAFRDTADQYMKAHPGSDINDVMTALCMMMVMHCIVNDVGRTETLRNVGMTYDNMNSTKDMVGRLN